MFTEVYLAGRDRDWRNRVGLPGICFGLAMLAKASALPFAALIMCVLEVPRLWARTKAKPIIRRLPFTPASSDNLAARPWAFRWDSWIVFCIGMLTVHVYCGSDWRPESRFRGLGPSRCPAEFAHDIMLIHRREPAHFPECGQRGSSIRSSIISADIWRLYHGGLVMRGPSGITSLSRLTMKLTIPVILLLGLTVILQCPRSYANALGLLAGTSRFVHVELPRADRHPPDLASAC